jgi:hypothetical protein
VSDQDTISTLGTEIGSAFEPLALAFRSPAGFSALMERMGWQFDSVPAALNSIRTPAESVAAVIQGGEFDSSEMPQLLAAIASPPNQRAVFHRVWMLRRSRTNFRGS